MNSMIITPIFRRRKKLLKQGGLVNDVNDARLVDNGNVNVNVNDNGNVNGNDNGYGNGNDDGNYNGNENGNDNDNGK